jgi:hypothetical protein
MNQSKLVAPKGLRLAISITLTVLGAFCLIIGILFLIALSAAVGYSSSGIVVGMELYLVLGIFCLFDSALYLVFGIMGCVKAKDGLFHKKIVEICLIIVGICSALGNLITMIQYANAGLGGLSFLSFLVMSFSIVQTVFLFLAMNDAKKGGRNEKRDGVIAVSFSLGATVLSGLANIVFYSASNGVASHVISLLISSALGVLYILYFVKLKDMDSAVAIDIPTNSIQIDLDKADALKKYKDLLDAGAISQAEYDRKKSDLLK